MAENYKSFSDLQRKYRNGRDYRIRTVDRGGTILIFAPHGGGIERGTSELAKAIASNDLSYYLFEGIMKKARDSCKMHITCTRFDEPICLELIGKFHTAIAIHGCVGKKPVIYVGGRDNQLKIKFIDELKQKGYPIDDGKGHYPGTYSTNICNRTFSRKGVQLEFSKGMRRLLFEEWETRKGRKITTQLFDSLVSEIRIVINNHILNVA